MKIMGNRGVLLYVDLGKLEDEPYRLSKIYDTLGQYIDDIRRQRDIIYISKMAESLDISSLDRYRAQLVDEYDRLGTLKKILDEAYDLYKECNEKFEASGQTLCNLYAETPWYETSEGKLAIGIGVLVVTAAVAIVCPAVLGATAAAVTQSVATSALVGSAISGIMNGAASVKAGKSFFDGFASGVEEGAIIGALCGMFGAGTAVMMTGAEMTVGNVFAARVINAVGDATIGTATYIYHENKYDKAITGGDVAKTWAECAITSFVLRSVFEGGKSSSKADGKNRGMSTSKGRVESERSITCEGGSTTIDDVTGMDWYNYYRDTYGKENVCWESCNPSEVASAWQGSYPYTGVDAYTNITLHDGDIIYMGEPFPTGYSTTSEVAQTIGNDAQKVFGGLQVKPYYEKGMAYAEYRSKLTPYKVHGELNVADGVALNNPQFGQGGLTQRFDPNFDFNCANGVLEKLDNQTISLTNTKISLEEYFGMMNEIK
ncbi:MAG: hypothetical protein V8R09_00200 [Coprococcus sp.]